MERCQLFGGSIVALKIGQRNLNAEQVTFEYAIRIQKQNTKIASVRRLVYTEYQDMGSVAHLVFKKGYDFKLQPAVA